MASHGRERAGSAGSGEGLRHRREGGLAARATLAQRTSGSQAVLGTRGGALQPGWGSPREAREVARRRHLVALTGSLWRGPAGAGRRGWGSRGLDRSRPCAGHAGKAGLEQGAQGGEAAGARVLADTHGRGVPPQSPRWTQGRSLSLAPETMNCHLNRRLVNAYVPPPPCHPFSEAPGRPASLGRCGWWGAGTPLLGLLP